MKLAIFDMDGLMLDTERIGLKAWLLAAAESNITLTEEDCAQFRGTNKEHKRELFANWFGKDFDFETIYARRSYYLDKFIHDDGIPVKKGLFELLEALKEKGYQTIVATSTARNKATYYLESTHILPYFDQMICGDEVTKSKPDPEIFLKAAKKMNCPINDAFIFEDSFNGVRAGRAAGGVVVMVPDLAQPTEEIRKLTNYIFDDLSQAIKIL